MAAFYILPEHRGHGYASLFLKHIFDICRNRGFVSIVLSVHSKNKIAIHSYEKEGFVFVCEKRFLRLMRINFLIHNKV